MDNHSKTRGTKANPERRSRILAAARDIFAQEGYRNAEVKTIANAAGVGKATIYKHFQSKDEILLTIVDENFHLIKDIALQNLISGGHPLDRLERTCLAMAQFLAQNKPFSMVLIKEAGEFMPQIQRLYNTVVDENAQFAHAFFDLMKSENLLPDLPNQTILELFLNLAIGTVYSWTLSEDRDLIEDVRGLFRLWHDNLAQAATN
jgi:AcrR family transcriptional regulator